MPTTINDIQDLVRILEDRPEWRSELQRILLTQELLETPARLNALTETVETLSATVSALSQNVADLTEAVSILQQHAEATNRRLDGMDVRLDKLEETVAALVLNAEATNRRLDGMNDEIINMNNSIKTLADAQTRTHQSLDRFRGNYASEGAWNNRREIAELFADTNRAGRPRLKTFSDEELDDMLDGNLEVIDALEEEGDVLARFGRADLIVLAERRRTREPLYWIAAESSYTVDAGDIVRASDNAKFLRAATGQNAYGVVAGVQLDPQIEERYGERVIHDLEQFLESDRDDVVYWFNLTDTSVQPRSPR